MISLTDLTAVTMTFDDDKNNCNSGSDVDDDGRVV